MATISFKKEREILFFVYFLPKAKTTPQTFHSFEISFQRQARHRYKLDNSIRESDYELSNFNKIFNNFSSFFDTDVRSVLELRISEFYYIVSILPENSFRLVYL